MSCDVPLSKNACFAVNKNEHSYITWHRRLEHLHSTVMHKILSTLPKTFHYSLNKSILDSSFSFYDSCQLGKLHHVSFPHSHSQTATRLEIVHNDVWGPAPFPSFEGFRYYVQFLDAYSRYTWLFPLRTKAEVKFIFIKFHHLAERQFGNKMKCLQSDQAGEFLALHSYLTDLGIQFRHSCPHVHPQSGRSERKHRHIVET